MSLYLDAPPLWGGNYFYSVRYWRQRLQYLTVSRFVAILALCQARLRPEV
jgi:hypothetical protein